MKTLNIVQSIVLHFANWKGESLLLKKFTPRLTKTAANASRCFFHYMRCEFSEFKILANSSTSFCVPLEIAPSDKDFLLNSGYCVY
jgi:hypothetical protein